MCVRYYTIVFVYSIVCVIVCLTSSKVVYINVLMLFNLNFTTKFICRLTSHRRTHSSPIPSVKPVSPGRRSLSSEYTRANTRARACKYTCMRVQIHLQIHGTHVCKYTCKYTCTRVKIHVHARANTLVHRSLT